jgi:hypothetical protein
MKETTMSNLKHGFYSKDVNINPDCLMMKNVAVKQALLRFKSEIISVVNGKIVKPGVTDLVVYLIDCALPHREELLPEEHLKEINDYYCSRVFAVLSRDNSEKSLQALIRNVESFQ